MERKQDTDRNSAVILAFAGMARRDVAMGGKAALPALPAQILLFSGVRYEPLPDSKPQKSTPNGRRRARLKSA
ncbi:MAG: hypothetical protein MUC58_13035 [Rhizobiaceae bacterium]|jgi:hypothetical protein|nr:hypothetical protein [Rhizobiaceae bacterium]